MSVPSHQANISMATVSPKWVEWWYLLRNKNQTMVTGGFLSQRPVTRSFDVFFDVRPNKRLSKQSRRRDLGRHGAHFSVAVMLPSDWKWNTFNSLRPSDAYMRKKN